MMHASFYGSPVSNAVYGLSDTSATVFQRLSQIEARQNNTVSLQNSRDLLNEVSELCVECSEAGWDGYDAKPLHKDALQAAQRFLKTIPHSVMKPLISAEPIGYLAFLWEREDGIIFSVSATNDKLYYAGLLGDKKINGQARNLSGYDDSIVNTLKAYFGEGS